MRNLVPIVILASIVLAGCGTSAQVQPALGFAFVTAAPNASATPTPFQPVPWTPTGTFFPTPTINPVSKTPSPALTQTEVPTIDPNMLVNTLEPLSTIDPSGSQVLNNGQDTVNFLLIGSDRRPGGSFRTDTMVIAMRLLATIVLPIGAAIALWNAWTVLRSRRSWWAKLWSLVLAASCLALLWVGIACHVVGFNANY